jgi:hypothetical protein
MNFDMPPRTSRVLTIVQAPSGLAWVHYWPNTVDLSLAHDQPGSDQYIMSATIRGFARSVVAPTVGDAMRIAADYWAEPRSTNNERGLGR